MYPRDVEEGRPNLLEWIETFPDWFVEEGKALKAQVLTLPWERWARNWDDYVNKRLIR
ncbi:hypothetical protein PM082_003692 [Marasmius tenuissimus]|nr:hypothetical protein PM082_003692 [Marasmius tenuissimus]